MTRSRSTTLLVTLALVVFDFSSSLISTCPIYQGQAADSGNQNYCSLSNGFIFFALKASFLYIAKFLHAYEHELVAGFTIVLAISTIGLWVSTRALWRAGERQVEHAKEVFGLQLVETQNQIDVARIGANAAKESADAAIATERARFYIVIEDNNFDGLIGLSKVDFAPPKKDEDDIGIIKIQYRFKNYGKTPGIIREISIEAMFATDPIDPVYSVLLDEIPEHMVAGSGGETGARHYRMQHALTKAQVKAMERNDSRVWFCGRLDYDDVFGKGHTHRFYFRTVTFNGRCFLQSLDHKHYNQST